MSSEDRTAIKFLGGFVLFVGILVALAVSASNNTEGDSLCYQNYVAAYTWTPVRSELKPMIADRKLTLSECEQIPRLVDRAKKLRILEKIK